MAVIDKYLNILLESNGSDLHITSRKPIKMRINSELVCLDDQVMAAAEVEKMLREIVTLQRWERFTEACDLDFAYESENCGRFRVNFFRDKNGYGGIFRYIPAAIPPPQELRIPESALKLCEVRSGLILITGPTGSGKSTTLSAMLDYINKHKRRFIITLEDPLEFIHENINSYIVHREIGSHGESFPSAINIAAKANPDILMIGELRDKQTMRAALHCAAMGMLVFSTLHTNNAAKTIERIIESFAVDEQPLVRTVLAESLAGVISQVLCNKKSGGRVACYEILLRTETLPTLIRDGNIGNINNIIESHRLQGMMSLDAGLKELLLNGVITAEEAFMKASDKKIFQQYVPFI